MLFLQGLTRFLFLSACVAALNIGAISQQVAEKADLDYQTPAVLYMQKAAEYRALAYQAYNLARLRLERSLHRGRHLHQAPPGPHLVVVEPVDLGGRGDRCVLHVLHVLQASGILATASKLSRSRPRTGPEGGCAMKTIELGHAVLYVRDLERSRHFYGEVLGLPEIGPAFPGAAAFSGGRTHHELLLIEVGPSAASPPPGRRTGLYHLGFKIGTTDDELRDAIRDLQDAGVTIVGASDHTVTHSLYIQDPDGNELELYIDVQPERWRDEPALVMAPTKPLQI